MYSQPSHLHRGRLVFSVATGHIRSMPLPNLTDGEQADLERLGRDAIAADRYFLAPRSKRLKSILAKLDPASTERTVTQYPAPRPCAEPSLLYQKLKGGK